MTFKYLHLVAGGSNLYYDKLKMNDEWFFLFACKKDDLSESVSVMRDSAKKSLILSSIMGDDLNTLEALVSNCPNAYFYKMVLQNKINKIKNKNEVIGSRLADYHKFNFNYKRRALSLLRLRNLDLIDFFKDKKLRFNSINIFLKNMQTISANLPMITSASLISNNNNLSEYRDRIFTESSIVKMFNDDKAKVINKLPKNNLVITNYNLFLRTKPSVISTGKLKVLDIDSVYSFDNEIRVKKNMPKIKLSNKDIFNDEKSISTEDELGRRKIINNLDKMTPSKFLEKYGEETPDKSLYLFLATMYSSNIENVPSFKFFHSKELPPALPVNLRWSRYPSRRNFHGGSDEQRIYLEHEVPRVLRFYASTDLSIEQQSLLEFGYNRIFTKKVLARMCKNKKIFLEITFPILELNVYNFDVPLMYAREYQLNSDKRKKIQRIFNSRSMINVLSDNREMIYTLSLFNKIALYDINCDDFVGILNRNEVSQDDSYSGITIYKSSKNIGNVQDRISSNW